MSEEIINTIPNFPAEIQEVQPVPIPVDKRPVVRILKTRCFNCSYLKHWNKKAKNYKCHTNPECTARMLRIIIGSDPDVLASKLAYYLANPTIDPESKNKLMSTLITREDSASIILKASQIVTEENVEAPPM